MTNADRDSAAKQLRAVLQRLEVAQQAAEDSAERYCKAHPTTNQAAFQLGALEQIVKGEIIALRSVISTYMMPAAPCARGPRFRR
jgi:uncharacterized protein involved in exopolysaccharide biosynthesis